jgi:hypothetical protein
MCGEVPDDRDALVVVVVVVVFIGFHDLGGRRST